MMRTNDVRPKYEIWKRGGNAEDTNRQQFLHVPDLLRNLLVYRI